MNAHWTPPSPILAPRRRFAAAATIVVFLAAAAACGGVNASVSIPSPSIDEPATTTETNDRTAVLAGGCFWGIEAVFEHVKGVKNVTSGYAGGSAATAHYELVGTGRTGHAESVSIVYDRSQISYGQLLKVFFSVAHDPTELNRQGPDEGTQYRSSIFYVNEEQKQVATAYIKQLTDAKIFRRPIVTTVVPLDAFYPAEAYHQNFLVRNPTYPYIVYNDLPKVKHLEQEFPAMVKGK